MKYWTNEDFRSNKIYWSKRSEDENIKIRLDNLKCAIELLEQKNIFYFLEGRTLKSIFETSTLDPLDHDDDLGIFHKDKNKLLELKEDLKDLGFIIIRNNGFMISILRNKRYIDVCLFKKSLNKIGYGNKKFDKKYYKSFEKIIFENYELNIPSNSKKLLEVRYEKN